VLLLAKIWAIGYSLLVLCIILGVAAIVRPSRRKPEKPEEKPLV
jgi:hypothetical protein